MKPSYRRLSSMAEAYGRHTDNRLHPMPDHSPIPAHEIALYIVSVIATLVVAALVFFER